MSYIKLDKKVKRQWLKALRGMGAKKYRQGHKQLRHAGRYCCLGVLVDVVAPETWTRDGQSNTRGGYPTNTFNEQVGLDDRAMKKLATMNDDEGDDYFQIADWIEENL